MKKLTVFILLILFALNSIAQKDSSGKGMLIYWNISYKFSVIEKKRTLLLKEFEAGNMIEVSNMIKKYKKEFDDKRYKFLTFQEECLLYYWLKDFSYLKDTVSNLDKDYIVLLNLKQTPEDSLRNILMNKILEDKKSIETDILSSNLHQEDKDFLVLYLSYLLKPENFGHKAKASKEFIKKYKKTQYKSLIENNMQYTPNELFKNYYYKIQLGLSFGYGVLSEKFNEDFSNIFIGSLDCDFRHRDFLLSLRLSFGSNKTKKELVIDDILFEEDHKTNFLS